MSSMCTHFLVLSPPPPLLPPVRAVPEEMETLKLDQIEVTSHVGGLVKSFHRKAA